MNMDRSDERPTPAPLPEELWSGSFGDEYVERNAQLDDRRRGFWTGIVDEFAPASVLEVGCGQGGNLLPLSQILAARQVWGIDINEAALARARTNAPGVNVVYGSARGLPFRDATFDLVFTTGVLIHQPDDQLPLVMDEMVRSSARYVLIGGVSRRGSDRASVPWNDGGVVQAELRPTLPGALSIARHSARGLPRR